MAVRIRLTRVGATKQPTYRVVVADARNARDGRSIETIGHYNPRTEPIEFDVDADKAKKWLAQGAQPSDTVARLFRNAGILPAGEVGSRHGCQGARRVRRPSRSSTIPTPSRSRSTRDPDGTVLELHVAEDDMGKVIGRNGSVAKALRTLLKVTARPRRRAGLARDRLTIATPGRRALVVGLVRGVHGLNGAIRVEILTDRPEARFARGAVLYREGSTEPLPSATRWPSPTVPAGGCASRGSATGDCRHPARRLPRGRRADRATSLPRGAPTGTRSSASRAAGRTASELGTVADIYRVAETTSTWSAAGHAASSTCRRSATSSGSSPRVGARSWSMPRRSSSARSARRSHPVGRARAAALRRDRRAAVGAVRRVDGRDIRRVGAVRHSRRARGRPGGLSRSWPSRSTPQPLPGDARGAACREHPRPHPGARPRRRSGSTTSALWGLGRHR